MDAIIVRRDVQGKLVVFFPDSFNKPKNTICVWDGKHKTGKQETTADYYFTSKPADEKEIAEMSEAYTKEFGVDKLLIRRRLIKEHVMARSAEHMNEDAKDTGKTAEALQADKKAFIEALRKAFNKAMDEALAAA